MNAKQLAYAALMCTLIIVSTLWFKFTLPGTDVLFTTQVFFVLLCGQLLNVRCSVYALSAYLLLGLAGLPVFSAVSGVGVIATPSFGYLLGFPFAAAAVAFVRTRVIRAGRYAASLAGIVVNYIVALAYIAVLKGCFLGAPVPMDTLLTSYCLAFLPADLVKGFLAALLGGRLARAAAV